LELELCGPAWKLQLRKDMNQKVTGGKTEERGDVAGETGRAWLRNYNRSEKT